MTCDRLKLRILHTNDIHSHFEQMPRIASLLGRLRAEAGADHTVTLDIGDHMDRMRPETEGSQGLANIAVMNATGYEAVTLGNNEGLTYTEDVLTDLYSNHAEFKVVIGNLFKTVTGRAPEWAEPWHIIEKAGAKIGLIGVTACFPEFYELLGWDVKEPFEIIKRQAEELRPKVDVLIVLSHLGLRNDERMAQEIPGIDLILGGHTHHLLEEPIQVGNTLICAAGKFGQYVGVVDLEIDPCRHRLIQASGAAKAVIDEEEDGRVRRLIEEYAASSTKKLEREVVRLKNEMPIDWFGESRLGNLLAAGLRRWVDAEIGLVNAGQMLGGLPQGPITEGMLLRLCPSPINPCRLKLTGAQLMKALEESILPEFMEKAIYGFGFRGKVLGTLCVDGLTIEYDPLEKDYSKIRGVWVGSEPLEPDRHYTVGTIDMFTFGIGYLSISEGTEREYFLPEFLRDVILQELLDEPAMDDSIRQRWFSTATTVTDLQKHDI